MDREILCRVLKKAMKARTMVYIYNDATKKDSWYVGFVQLVTKDYLVLETVTRLARADGHLIIRLDLVFRADTGGLSGTRMERLYALHHEQHERFDVSTFGNLFENGLQMALAHKAPISVDLDQDDERETLNGYVRQIAKDHIVMEDFDDNANSYGEIHFERVSIVDVQWGTRDLKNLDLLYRQESWD
ncbi:hypothetical protein [Listeria grandensis]|uniref:hypothetical protein n=1 Tax=Listeria grandensis TaxID=1494963 RepID=UPI00164DC089|nr:hypothetical protein [Listeria grandensis]MBC6315428.1 hypothetical protein [Listeria grandensis]